MEHLSIGDMNALYLVIPGFVVVWSFRHFSHSTKAGDFEFLGLSAVWGLILVVLVEGAIHLVCRLPWDSVCPGRDPGRNIQELFSNPYAFAILMLPLGFAVGGLGSAVTQTKWFRKIAHLG